MAPDVAFRRLNPGPGREAGRIPGHRSGQALPLLLDLASHPNKTFFIAATFTIDTSIRENPGDERILSCAQSVAFDEPKGRDFRVWYFKPPGRVTDSAVSRLSDGHCLQDLAYFMGKHQVREASWSLRKMVQDQCFNELDKRAAVMALESL